MLTRRAIRVLVPVRFQPYTTRLMTNSAIPLALPVPQLDRSIVLVGIMGAGKTTVGRRLARHLGVGFADSDVEIEKAAALPVSEIFAVFGEAEFRSGERRVIARLLDEPKPYVIATGGGAFMNDETRALIKRRALSIWLKADIDVLMDRVSRRDTRPLLRTSDPRAVMEKLLNQRAPIYAEADLHIDTDNGPHRATVEKIVGKLMDASQ